MHLGAESKLIYYKETSTDKERDEKERKKELIGDDGGGRSGSNGFVLGVRVNSDGTLGLIVGFKLLESPGIDVDGLALVGERCLHKLLSDPMVLISIKKGPFLGSLLRYITLAGAD